MIKIAGFTGAKVAIAVGIGNGRWAAARVDAFNQARTFNRGDELAKTEQLKLVRRHAAHADKAEQVCRIRFAGAIHTDAYRKQRWR